MAKHTEIRIVTPQDAAQIAAIYNKYVLHTDISFETEPLSADEMRGRIESISANFPYYVYEEDGRVLGYCYVHPWKERAAYNQTLETTIYLSIDMQGHGHRPGTDEPPDRSLPPGWLPRLGGLHHGRQRAEHRAAPPPRFPPGVTLSPGGSQVRPLAGRRGPATDAMIIRNYQSAEVAPPFHHENN